MRYAKYAGRALAASVVMVMANSLGAEQARAGTFVMRNCQVPGFPIAPLGPWRSSPPPNMAFVNECSTGGGFGFTFSGARAMAGDTAGTLAIARPIEGPRSVIELRSVRLWATALLSGTGNRMYVRAQGDGVSTVPLGQATLTAPYDSGTMASGATTFAVTLWCQGVSDAPPQEPCYAQDAKPFEVHGAEVTLSENVAPTASIDGGTLVAGKVVTGTRTLSFSASDHESGLKRIEVVMGDVVVAARDLSSICTHTDFTVCPTLDQGSLTVDTGQVVDGLYPLRLRTIDAAGNRHEVQHQIIEVQNGVQPLANPSIPARASVDRVRFSARFAGSPRSRLVVPFGRGAKIRGRLSSSHGALKSARVAVYERIARSGAKEVLVDTLRTRANGTFTYALAKHGPSRTVRLTYTMEGSQSVISKRLILDVRAASSLRAILRGTTVRFGGRVMTKPLPARGKRVALEGRAPGYQWATFFRIRTDYRGRFSGTYRLPLRRPGVKLQVRVSLPAEANYPYRSFRGQPLTLRVR